MEDTINFSAFKLGECESFLSWKNFNRKLESNLMRKTCETFSSFFFLLEYFFPDYFYRECLSSLRNLSNLEL